MSFCHTDKIHIKRKINTLGVLSWKNRLDGKLFLFSCILCSFFPYKIMKCTKYETDIVIILLEKWNCIICAVLMGEFICHLIVHQWGKFRMKLRRDGGGRWKHWNTMNGKLLTHWWAENEWNLVFWWYAARQNRMQSFEMVRLMGCHRCTATAAVAALNARARYILHYPLNG